MGAVEVVGIHEPVEVPLQLLQGVVSGLSQCHLELFQDGSVDPFGEAVGPRVFDQGVAMSDPVQFGG